jgi:oligoribonuclease
MERYMPKLNDFFHYRNVDVSTLKELAARWAPDVKKAFQKKTRHTALADVYESIDELKHYRDHFLKLPAVAGAEVAA